MTLIFFLNTKNTEHTKIFVLFVYSVFDKNFASLREKDLFLLNHIILINCIILTRVYRDGTTIMLIVRITTTAYEQIVAIHQPFNANTWFYVFLFHIF